MVAADMLESKREALAEAAAGGAVVLAVCGGYQLLGHSYQLDDERLPGLGLVDLETVREPGPAPDRQRRDRGRPRPRPAAASPASRTTAGAPTSAPEPSRWAGSSPGTATTVATASRECGRRT